MLKAQKTWANPAVTTQPRPRSLWVAAVLPTQQEGRQAQRREAHKQRAQQAVRLGSDRLLLLWVRAVGCAGRDLGRGGHHGGQLQRVASCDEVPAGRSRNAPATCVHLCDHKMNIWLLLLIRWVGESWCTHAHGTLASTAPLAAQPPTESTSPRGSAPHNNPRWRRFTWRVPAAVARRTGAPPSVSTHPG